MTSPDPSPLSLSIPADDADPPPHEFPSPSSSFLPPPIIGGEEFALPSASTVRMRGNTKTIDKVISEAAASGSMNGKESEKGGRPLSTSLGTDPGATTTDGKAGAPVSSQTDSPSMQRHQSTPSSGSIYSESPDGLPINNPRRQMTRQASLASLRSTRVAPESPGASRRQSRLLQQASGSPRSGSPTPQSLSQSPHTSPQMHRPSKSRSRLSVSFTSAQAAQIAQQTKKKRAKAIIIRDYGFQSTDERFEGRGTHVPKPCRPAVLNRALRATSTASFGGGGGSGTEDEGEDEDDNDGTQWGFESINAGASGRLSWMSGLSGVTSGNGFPSHNDFARNFGDDIEEDLDDLDMDADDDEEPDLPPGIYTALYAFSPLSPSECALEPGTDVRVVGLAGGGGGWAVVERSAKEQQASADGLLHGLVPASYLELVRLEEPHRTSEDEE